MLSLRKLLINQALGRVEQRQQRASMAELSVNQYDEELTCKADGVWRWRLDTLPTSLKKHGKWRGDTTKTSDEMQEGKP